MSDRAPYSRVYWSVMDDEKFDTIRDDARLMGSWLLLLITADMAYPSTAYALPSVSKAALEKLAEVGLVDILGGRRYRVHGLDAERERRRILATTRGPSGNRPGTVRSPLGDQAEQSKAEPRRAEQTREAADDWDRPDLEAFLLVKRTAPSPRQRKLLDGLLDRHDVTGARWAADIILRNPDDPIGAVIRADKAWREEQIAKAQQAERPKVVPHRPKGLPTAAKDLLEHWAAAKRDEGAA